MRKIRVCLMFIAVSVNLSVYAAEADCSTPRQNADSFLANSPVRTKSQDRVRSAGMGKKLIQAVACHNSHSWVIRYSHLGLKSSDFIDSWDSPLCPTLRIDTAERAIADLDLEDYQWEKGVNAMPMKNSPHPGDFIRTEIIKPAGLWVSATAVALQVRVKKNPI